MSIERKISYNINTSKKFAWTPIWFGCDDFDQALIEAITAFQRAYELDPDGMCGQATYRRMWTIREADKDAKTFQSSSENQIIYANTAFPIAWDKVSLWTNPAGLKANKGTYSLYNHYKTRNPSLFVTHWDATLSASHCARILNNRGISVHFCIDNDGTVHQLLDSNHAAWHSGSRLHNRASIGVEISNAYYPKWQSWYIKKGFGARPIIKDAQINGRTLEPFLGFYPVQLEALVALYAAVHQATGIPFTHPSTLNGVDEDCTTFQFQGFCHHYHLTKRKIDCAGLDLVPLIEKARAITQSSSRRSML